MALARDVVKNTHRCDESCANCTQQLFFLFGQRGRRNFQTLDKRFTETPNIPSPCQTLDRRFIKTSTAVMKVLRILLNSCFSHLAGEDPVQCWCDTTGWRQLALFCVRLTVLVEGHLIRSVFGRPPMLQF